MSNPTGWDEAAADIIARDGDLEEPPPFRSGHDVFLEVEASYQGWTDPGEHDE